MKYPKPAKDTESNIETENEKSGVRVGIVARPAAPALLLTQRTAHLRDHAGQISLPGGRIEPDDADVDVARREPATAHGG